MNLRIVPFDPALRSHFGRLNREWLERYFVVEPIDADVLMPARWEYRWQLTALDFC